MNNPYFIKAQDTPEFGTGERCFITELCNTSAAPDASLAIARVAAGTTTQLHLLKRVTETCIVMAGCGDMEVDGQRFRIGVGDQIVIPAGVAQRVTALGDEDLRFYCVCTPRFTPGCYASLES